MKLRLTAIKPEAAATCQSFQFTPETPITWKAAQFLRYHLDNPHPDERKQDHYFTISSAPFEGFIQLTTRFNPEKSSTFKQDLKNLIVGQSVEAVGPMGIFLLEKVVPQQHYIFVAGGIGITPFRAILLELDHQKSILPITLLYANRDDQIVFQPELETLKTTHPEFTIQYFLGDNHIDKQAIQTVLAQYPQAIFYLSGPQPMVEGIEDLLEQMFQIPKDRIKLDYFPGYPTI